MSEGTMQRRAQRDQRDDQGAAPAPGYGQRGKEQRARRLRALAGVAALPLMLVAAGCSSGDSGSGSGSGGESDGAKAAGASRSSSASASPTVQAAAYRTLPKVCGVLSKKTLEDLVPEAKSGKEGTSGDTSTRASCSWSSLDNNGVKGSQFRWLNVSLLRFESDVTRGEGDRLAHDYYEKQVKDAKAVTGAENTKAAPVTGTGDEATSVSYDLKKKEGAFKQQTVVTRVENVVVTLDYNGAGLAGDKTPDAADLTKAAQKAAKEAVTAVSTANTASSSAQPSPSASTSASAKPSASASNKN
ncbi:MULTISPECIES: DUF3558 family protein [unclassified Streptomyces]|uniref:DUF3558 family protein n=1 Tax=unclassified Streptomyces TaxID=2593676 RepID=UPI001F04F36C|nr:MULTISPECIES: DUF3558 family protein [unclassified Streptomyces]MCH0563137.1 DUF3558 family protein [Streptomyces sp. MUM 2J]MCH0568566.1 DUF3558 family protein [Streptomyces sp. MUM 136J]